MSKIYVVSNGGYNEYRIKAVFSTRAAAQKYVDAAMFTDWNNVDDIKEYDIDSISKERPKIVAVGGFFIDDVLECIDFDEYDGQSWNFSIEPDKDVTSHVTFIGDVAVLPEETSEQFHKRASKVVIDKYLEWKAKQ